MKRIGLLTFAYLGFISTLGVSSLFAGTNTSPKFFVSICEDNVRTVDAEAMLTYSTEWEGKKDSTVTIAQNGVPLKRDLTGEGALAWTAEANGRYVLTHTTYDAKGGTSKVETATFVVTSGTLQSQVETPLCLNLKADGVRASSGEETLAYSSLWDGDETATVTIAQDGKTLTRELTGEGEQAWSVARNGRYELTHTTYQNGSAVKVERATFVVEGKDVPFSEAEVVVKGFDGPYDGKAHGISVTIDPSVAEATVRYALAENGEYEAENPLFTNVGERTVWCEIAAPGYITETNSAKVIIRKATVGGDEEGEEPDVPGEEPGTVPEGGLSKFDVTAVYDGEGHTIDTGRLVKAFTAAMGEDGTKVEYSWTEGDDEDVVAPKAWSETAPEFTDAGECVVWYKMTNSNYEDFVHKAMVTITPREVTLTSESKLDFVYDGQPHTHSLIIISEPGFVGDEGVEALNWATVTTVAEGAVDNTFDYEWKEGTLAANYDIATVWGKIAVVKGTLGGGEGEEPDVPGEGPGTVPEGGLSKFDTMAVYDGEGHTIDTGRLVKAFVAAMGEDGTKVEYSWTEGDDEDVVAPKAWREIAPAFTNVCEAVVWYRVTNPNYEDFEKAAKVTITPRAVTIRSASGSWTYDGAAHSRATVAVFDKDGAETAGGEAGVLALPKGGAVEISNFATITGVGTIANIFEYAFNEGTLAANYTVAVEYGTLEVTLATIDPSEVFGGAATEENPLVCARVYNGAAQGLALDVDMGDESFTFYYALTPGDAGAYGEASPTRTNVADGELKVYFKLVSPNFAPFFGVAILRIVPKTVTEEMLAYSDDAFFFDGESTKVPDVILADTDADGRVISTKGDYTRTYGARLATGEYPVTITGRNNYTGTVTKAFAVLKRPVAPPVIGGQSYNGRKRTASVPADARWTVVQNAGGIDAGDYLVVLRLTNTEDYRWAGQGEDETECMVVFTIRRAANGWSVTPGMKGWTYGETPSEPVARARYGSFLVAYRRKGTDLSTETDTRPSVPGTYIARFWVEESTNYAAVASKEVEFTIERGSYTGGDHTLTTPEPVPYKWLDKYLAEYSDGSDYEQAGYAVGKNGVALWESYVAGLDPNDPTSRFRAYIRMEDEHTPVVTWSPDLSKDPAVDVPRIYTVYGKDKLTDPEWVEVADPRTSGKHFFKVGVRLKK